jgi:organic radical activating enzyme
VQRRGNELKLVYPQRGLMPDAIGLRELDFVHLLLQPMDGPMQRENTQAAIAYCRQHPQWRLSVQMHKHINIR